MFTPNDPLWCVLSFGIALDVAFQEIVSIKILNNIKRGYRRGIGGVNLNSILAD